MSMIGVILLMGIVAKNAILLIDFAKWSEEAGMDRREALIQAGRVRLRPILMTTFALIAGMVPVALGGGEGGDFRAPLGIAVIGGVITSTLLTLLVIPTVYEILADTRDWLAARFFRSGDKAIRATGHAPDASSRLPTDGLPLQLTKRTVAGAELGVEVDAGSWALGVDAGNISVCTTRSFPRPSKAGASCT